MFRLWSGMWRQVGARWDKSAWQVKSQGAFTHVALQPFWRWALILVKSKSKEMQVGFEFCYWPHSHLFVRLIVLIRIYIIFYLKTVVQITILQWENTITLHWTALNNSVQTACIILELFQSAVACSIWVETTAKNGRITVLKKAFLYKLWQLDDI